MEGSLAGDTLHCPGHTFNLIFLFSFFPTSQLRLEGKKNVQTGPPGAKCAQILLALESGGLGPPASPAQGREHLCDHQTGLD